MQQPGPVAVGQVHSEISADPETITVFQDNAIRALTVLKDIEKNARPLLLPYTFLYTHQHFQFFPGLNS